MWDWLEELDYSKIGGVEYKNNKTSSKATSAKQPAASQTSSPNTENNHFDISEREYFDHPGHEYIYENKFKCSYCNLNYNFEYLIKENIVNKICYNHLSSFDMTKQKWKCCQGNASKMGCHKQCHDIGFHLKYSKSIKFPYFVQNENATSIINGVVYSHVLFQVPLLIWLKIMIKKYPKKIPIGDLKKDIHDILMFKNLKEYENYTKKPNEKGGTVDFNGKKYDITRSEEKSDGITIYVKSTKEEENYNFSKTKMEEEEEDEDEEDKEENGEEYQKKHNLGNGISNNFLNYSIVRYNVINILD